MESPLAKNKLSGMVISRMGMAVILLGVCIFLPAGTLSYWQAWAYLACLLVPMIGVFFYLMKHDPRLLERRMKYKERFKEQKLIIAISLPVFIAAFALPGFDKRFGWSPAPTWLVIVGLLLVMLGYLMFFLVVRENSYASRVIEVVNGQKVISSGPYAFVRHPMYLGVGMLYIATPLALGSLWSILPTLLVIPTLIARILNEEKVLLRDLPGYAEYTQKVKHRFFPGIW